MSIRKYYRQINPIHESKTSHVEKVQTLFLEAKAPRGAEFENIICAAYNMKSLRQDKDKAIQSAETDWKPLYDEWLDVGHKIVANSFRSPKGTMKHFGSGNAPLNPEWDAYFIKTTGKPAGGSTKTPKTDMYIGSEHISLKKYGGSQLMSGGKAETLATLAAAYDNLPDAVKSKALDESWNSLTDQIENEFISFKLPEGGQINDFKKAIKAGVDDDLTNWVKERLIGQQQLTETLSKLLSTKEVNREVVREAMTGNKKFKDSLPKATHILKFDERGKSNYVKIDDKYVDYVASQTSFNISFKTSGTGGSAWTATKGIFKEAYEYAEQECINEGLFDKVKGVVKSGVNFLKNMLKKMLSYIWTKVKGLIMSGIDKVQEVLGVRMDVSNGNPRVKF